MSREILCNQNDVKRIADEIIRELKLRGNLTQSTETGCFLFLKTLQ